MAVLIVSGIAALPSVSHADGFTGGGGAGRTYCTATSMSGKSSAGSRFILPGDSSYTTRAADSDGVIGTAYGWCHINKGHMQVLRTIDNPFPKVKFPDGTNKTQFSQKFREAAMFNLAMDVINTQPNKVPSGTDKFYKEIYTMYDGAVVRVLFHDADTFANGYFRKNGNHDFVIVTAYPRY